MQKINFQDYPNTTTPVNATNLNAIQSNAETSINEVDTKITTATTIGKRRIVAIRLLEKDFLFWEIQ